MKPIALKEAIKRYFAAGVIPFVKGSPGIGKSAIIREIASEYKLVLLDLRLGQCDPTDLLGFPHIDNGRSVYATPKDIPIVGDKIPAGMNGWLLFLDEMNTAPKAVQAAGYKLLDGMVGQNTIHPQCFIAAAGNKDTDGAITVSMSTATISRIGHLELDTDLAEWCIWAGYNGIDTRIITFVNFKKELFYKFDPKNNRETFPCPRTWHNASKVTKGIELSLKDLDVVGGIISMGAAREFIEFTQIYDKLPSLEKILASPESIEIPNEPSIKWAMAGFLADNLTPANADTLMKCINRLPVEFQIITVQTAFRTKPALTQAQSIMDWVQKYASDSGAGFL